VVVVYNTFKQSLQKGGGGQKKRKKCKNVYRTVGVEKRWGGHHVRKGGGNEKIGSLNTDGESVKGMPRGGLLKINEKTLVFLTLQLDSPTLTEERVPRVKASWAEEQRFMRGMTLLEG